MRSRSASVSPRPSASKTRKSLPPPAILTKRVGSIVLSLCHSDGRRPEESTPVLTDYQRKQIHRRLWAARNDKESVSGSERFGRRLGTGSTLVPRRVDRLHEIPVTAAGLRPGVVE